MECAKDLLVVAGRGEQLNLLLSMRKNAVLPFDELLCMAEKVSTLPYLFLSLSFCCVSAFMLSYPTLGVIGMHVVVWIVCAMEGILLLQYPTSLPKLPILCITKSHCWRF